MTMSDATGQNRTAAIRTSARRLFFSSSLPSCRCDGKRYYTPELSAYAPFLLSIYRRIFTLVRFPSLLPRFDILRAIRPAKRARFARRFDSSLPLASAAAKTTLHRYCTLSPTVNFPRITTRWRTRGSSSTRNERIRSAAAN